MRRLDGVVHIGYPGADLKHKALLFDRFHIWELQDEEYVKSPAYDAELDFLRSRGIVVDAPSFALDDFSESLEQRHFTEGFALVRTLEEKDVPKDHIAEATNASVRDLVNRYLVTRIEVPSDADLVPICEVPLPAPSDNRAGLPDVTNVATVALKGFPAPDSTTAWDDILAFKADESDKQWAFRRWLRDLATKNLRESEIRDEIEWSMHEYAKAMGIHKIKASQSFVDVFVISPLEIIENIVTFNWSKIAKGLLQVDKRKVDLMEAEMKAAGRESAYVFDARQRFGK